jgi:hypothetical protein
MLRAAVLVASVALLAVPAHAQVQDLPLRETDPIGDVNVFDGGGTKPTTGQRMTIDLKAFAVTRRSDGVRFTFRIARIAAGRTFDQVVEAQLRERGRDGYVFDVRANPQHKNGSALLDDVVCIADVKTSRRTGTVRVDVPAACVPQGAGVLRVSTYLQEKNGSGPGFSEDTLRVPGRVQLR